MEDKARLFFEEFLALLSYHGLEMDSQCEFSGRGGSIIVEPPRFIPGCNEVSLPRCRWHMSGVVTPAPKKTEKAPGEGPYR